MYGIRSWKHDMQIPRCHLLLSEQPFPLPQTFTRSVHSPSIRLTMIRRARCHHTPTPTSRSSVRLGVCLAPPRVLRLILHTSRVLLEILSFLQVQHSVSPFVAVIHGGTVFLEPVSSIERQVMLQGARAVCWTSATPIHPRDLSQSTRVATLGRPGRFPEISPFKFYHPRADLAKSGGFKSSWSSWKVFVVNSDRKLRGNRTHGWHNGCHPAR
ncbi:hypothetical protein BD779DRAFT_589132 [Infundibulicybe gibba]|nr:hypothetical protein BD779DRAFT_589132 [Infundibulicybe gibba]